jgi:hypothetical protein
MKPSRYQFLRLAAGRRHFGALQKAEIEKWRPIITAAGIKGE